MRKPFIVVLLAMALIVIGGGIAYASIPGPDGVIHGCYKTSNPGQGALIAIDSTASCPSGTTALNWNQTGPQGPQGPAGPSTAGPTGLDVAVFIGGATAFGYGSNVAVCPSDHPYIVGGGVDTGSGGGAVYQSEPAFWDYSTNTLTTVGSKGNGNSAAPNAWFTNNATNTGGIAYAICSK